MRDPYQVLGVSRDATGDEIKGAFRRLARDHHPDRNPNDVSAQGRFQEINAAYQVLGDPDRRAKFDRLGGDSRGPGPHGVPGGLEDWLSEILGGGRAAGVVAATGDLREELELDFEEAALGCKRTLTYERSDRCSRCDGAGAEPGTKTNVCAACAGQGRVRLGALGWIALGMDRACPECGGSGRLPEVPCAGCRGRGLEVKRRMIEVTLPPGIEPGAAQTISGAGSRTSPTRPAGDLELVIRVKPHPRFSRRGDDVLSDVSIDFVLAALGGEVTVDTLHGPAKLHVDPGTQPDRVLELRGKGIPHRFRSGAGDHRCRVRVVIPLAMSPEAKRLVEEFDRELTETERRSVWGRLASLFSG